MRHWLACMYWTIHNPLLSLANLEQERQNPLNNCFGICVSIQKRWSQKKLIMRIPYWRHLVMQKLKKMITALVIAVFFLERIYSGPCDCSICFYRFIMLLIKLLEVKSTISCLRKAVFVPRIFTTFFILWLMLQIMSKMHWI